MLRQEDDFPLREELDFIIPIGVIHVFGKEPVITYYEKAIDIAKWLDLLSEDILFSDSVILELETKISDLLQGGGYFFDETTRGETSYLFRLDSKEKLNTDMILPSTERIAQDSIYDNITDCELYENGLLCFGTVIDGKIVSAAAENPIFGEANEGDTIDIGVETDMMYRGRGYGASNVAAISECILDKGKKVSYIAGSRNASSIRLAEKIGFTAIGREYQCVLYKNDR